MEYYSERLLEIGPRAKRTWKDGWQKGELMVGSCTRIMAKKKLLLSFEDEDDIYQAILLV